MVFTRRFWLLLLAGSVFGLASLLSEGFVLYLVAWDVALLVVAFVTYRLAPKPDQFQAARSHDPVLSARTPNLVVVNVGYRGTERLQATIRDEPPPEFDTDRAAREVVLEPGKDTVLRYHVTPPDRGSFEFRELFLRVPAPLGLVLRTYRLPLRTEVAVYPNILALRKYDLLMRRGHLREIGIRRATLKGAGSEFESLREYQVGDDIRRLDWKATARRGKPVVRQYQAERSQPVILALDLGRLMLAEVDGVSKYDHVIDAALMLAHAAVEAQDRVGLLLYHDRVVRFAAPQKGRAQIGRILQELHGIQPEAVESDLQRALNHLRARWRRRSLVVVFTDLVEPESSAGTLSALLALRSHHLCMAVAVSDPKIESLTSRSPNTPKELYERAVATHISEDRRAAVTRLQNAGIRVVDAEPERLAAALVNEYTSIKARGLL
ncbi:MAG: DUF58 domain-containing protein [Fimbriimonadia bacterium]|jgi:uncharacterized protein (DUF58 family)